RVAHPAGRAHRTLEHRGSAVDGEFGLSIKNHEHLFVCVVKMMSHATAGHDLAAVNEVEIYVHRRGRYQQLASHVSGAVMRTAARVLAGIGMSNPLRERSAGAEGHGCEKNKRDNSLSSESEHEH